jgi:hypothetical protein
LDLYLGRYLVLLVITGLISVNALPASNLAVGQPFPSILLPSLLDGKPLSVKDFQGKKTVLHIWASW